MAPQKEPELHLGTGQYRWTEHSRKAKHCSLQSWRTVDFTESSTQLAWASTAILLMFLMGLSHTGIHSPCTRDRNPQHALRYGPAVNRVHKHLHRSGTIVIKVWGPLCSSLLLLNGKLTKRTSMSGELWWSLPCSSPFVLYITQPEIPFYSQFEPGPPTLYRFDNLLPAFIQRAACFLQCTRRAQAALFPVRPRAANHARHDETGTGRVLRDRQMARESEKPRVDIRPAYWEYACPIA